MLISMGFKHLELIRDVDTRWSSTLLMIARALELEKVRFKLFWNFQF